MKSYSEDLREKIVVAVESGISKSEAARLFEAFSKVKGLLRKAQARTRDALVEAMGRALYTVSAQDARGFFEHAGYHQRVQLL